MDHLVPESVVPANRDRIPPPALTSSDPTSFAWSVIHRRHPLVIEQARVAHPYGPAQIAALQALAVEMTDGVATTGDVAACLRRLASAGGYAAAAARRLHKAFGDGRVRLRTSWFSVAPLEFDAMPADLAAEFGRATPERDLARLDSEHPDWRVSGTHAMIQIVT